MKKKKNQQRTLDNNVTTVKSLTTTNMMTKTTTTSVKLEKHASIPWRAFPTWEEEMGIDVPLPCVYNKDEAQVGMMSAQWSKASTGLLYVKVEKTGSSTFAGIATRLAYIIYHRSSEKEKRRRHYFSVGHDHNSDHQDPTSANSTNDISTSTIGADLSGSHETTTTLIMLHNNNSHPMLIDDNESYQRDVEDNNTNKMYIFEISQTNNKNKNTMKSSLNIWFPGDETIGPTNNQTKQQHRQQQERPSNRFLWSIVRRVPSRDISHYFHFMVTRKNHSTSDGAIIHYLKSTSQLRNQQLKYLFPFRKEIDGIARARRARAATTTTATSSSSSDERSWYPIIDRVLNKFNFIGTLERMDESLVLLQFTMGLKASDVIPMNAKISSQMDSYDPFTCKPFVKSFVSPKVKEYLKSDEYYYLREGDFLFYDAVNQSMDRTIETVIGSERFQRALEEFRHAKYYATKVNNCTSINPCLQKGVKNPKLKKFCYSGDKGCGHQCLDDLFGWD